MAGTIYIDRSATISDQQAWDVIVKKSADILAYAGDALTLENVDNTLIDVFGSIFADVDRAITLDYYSDNVKLRIAESGSVTSDFYRAVMTEGANTTLRNAGEITGATAAIYATGTSTRLINTGTITGTSDAYTAITMSGDGSEVKNKGLVQAEYFAFDMNANYVTFENTGKIFGYRGVIITGEGAFLDNSGVIKSEAAAVNFIGGASDVVNSGKLISDGHALVIAGGNLENTGLLKTTGTSRAVYASGSTNIENEGKIVGHVLLSTQGDRFEMVKGGTVSGRVLGSGGEDLMIAAKEAVTFEGGDDNDSLFGGKGDDVLKGDAGEDYIYTGKGDDIVSGGTGDDTFIFERKKNGITTITDYTDDEDALSLMAYTGNLADLLDDAVRDKGHRTIINLAKLGSGMEGKIILENFGSDYGDLIATDDFIYLLVL